MSRFQVLEGEDGCLGEPVQDGGGIVGSGLLQLAAMLVDLIPERRCAFDEAQAKDTLHLREAREAELLREANDGGGLNVGLPRGLRHRLQREAVGVSQGEMGNALQVWAQALVSVLELFAEPVEVLRRFIARHAFLQRVIVAVVMQRRTFTRIE